MDIMRIAVWHNLPSGGGKRALYYHVQGLLERGHTVESWCPPTADQSYLPLGKIIKENIIPLKQEKNLLNKAINKYLNPYAKVIKQINSMDSHCKKCAVQINSGDFDILFANACSFFRTTSIAEHVNIPTSIYLGEPYRWLYEAMPTLPWMALPKSSLISMISPLHISKIIHNFLYVQGLRVQVREEVNNAKFFDLILVNSLYSRESILRAYGLESKVCYLGIDTDLFKPLDLPRQNLLIGLGAIYPGKGIERSIHAISQISENIRPNLIWVGNFSNPSYQVNIENLANSLNVKIIVKVGISDKELVDLLNQASVMIYTPFLEPFGFAPLEANSCRTPVVAIAEGGVRESIINELNGFLIHENDSKALGKSIQYLLENKDYAHLMGLRARNYILDKWSLKESIDRLEEVLLKLIKK